MSLDKSSREHQTTSQLEMIGERKHSAFLQQRKKIAQSKNWILVLAEKKIRSKTDPIAGKTIFLSIILQACSWKQFIFCFFRVYPNIFKLLLFFDGSDFSTKKLGMIIIW